MSSHKHPPTPRDVLDQAGLLEWAGTGGPHVDPEAPPSCPWVIVRFYPQHEHHAVRLRRLVAAYGGAVAWEVFSRKRSLWGFNHLIAPTRLRDLMGPSESEPTRPLFSALGKVDPQFCRIAAADLPSLAEYLRPHFPTNPVQESTPSEA